MLDAIIDALIVTGVSLTVNVLFFLWFLSYLEKRMDRMLEKDDEPSFRDMAKDPHLRRLVVEDMNPKIYEKIGIAFGKWHGRPDLDDVVIGSVRAEQDSALAHAVGDKRSFFSRRFKCLPVAHQFYPEEQP